MLLFFLTSRLRLIQFILVLKEVIPTRRSVRTRHAPVNMYLSFPARTN